MKSFVVYKEGQNWKATQYGNEGEMPYNFQLPYFVKTKKDVKNYLSEDGVEDVEIEFA